MARSITLRCGVVLKLHEESPLLVFASDLISAPRDLNIPTRQVWGCGTAVSFELLLSVDKMTNDSVCR